MRAHILESVVHRLMNSKPTVISFPQVVLRYAALRPCKRIICFTVQKEHVRVAGIRYYNYKSPK